MTRDDPCVPSGQRGKQLVWHLGRSGKSVAVVERQWVGGSCPAVACLPSKNEIWSARVAHLVRHAGSFGTAVDSVRTDMARVRRRKQDMMDREIEALELADVPPHLIVLGGGYTGIEMAQAYGRFGSRVTIIEPGPQIMGREDADVAEAMGTILGGEGIDILLSAKPLRVSGRNGQTVSVTVGTAAGERTIEGSHLLVAVGRVANTAGIGLDEAGIALNERGFIQVDERLKTTDPGVCAIGECAGSPQFTHVSVDDFRIVRDNMAGGNRTTSDRLIPHVVFTDPPLARVGLSEGDAQRHSIPVRVAKLPMRRVLRTAATDETAGFMKVLVGAKDDRILGFAMIGSEAGEVMAAIQTAILAEMPYTKLRDAVIAHLTVAEGLGPLFEGVPPRAG